MVLYAPEYSTQVFIQVAAKDSRTATSSITIPRPSHNISRADISESALKVLYRLKNAGFEGYLVGGGVRDLLLGREPKDFDVVTDAARSRLRRYSATVG